MPLLIQQARLVNADADFVADLYAAGDTITTIAAHLDPATLATDTTVIDGRGKLLFPGFIDPHVHIHLPFMGTSAKDDHATASRAALVGGTTTYLEMICPARRRRATRSVPPLARQGGGGIGPATTASTSA